MCQVLWERVSEQLSCNWGGSLVDLVVTRCQTCGEVQYWIHGARCHIYGVVYYTTSVVVWFEKLVDRNLAEQSGLVTLQPSQHPIIPLNWRTL